MKKYVLIKEEEIISRKPYKFKPVFPIQYLTDSHRWTKNINKAKIFTENSINMSIVNNFNNSYMYGFKRFYTSVEEYAEVSDLAKRFIEAEKLIKNGKIGVEQYIEYIKG